LQEWNNVQTFPSPVPLVIQDIFISKLVSFTSPAPLAVTIQFFVALQIVGSAKINTISLALYKSQPHEEAFFSIFIFSATCAQAHSPGSLQASSPSHL
jgi:hypothetical protein